MAQSVNPRPRSMSTRRSFAIVASEYNPELVQELVNHAADQINTLSAGATVVLYQVPGAFEIPIVVQELARTRIYSSILALGVIIYGKTDHGRLIAETVTDHLMRIALEHRVPVVHEIITAPDEATARDRVGPKFNRGVEAARAAVEMAQLLNDIARREGDMTARREVGR